MHLIFNYVEENQLFFLIFFGMILGILFLWGLCLRQCNKTKQMEQSIQRERAFYESFSEESDHVFLSVRRHDLMVLYTSSNLCQVTGLQKDQVFSDIETLFALTSPYTTRALRQKLKEWDFHDEFSEEFPYHKIGEDQIRHGKLLISWDQKEDVYLLSFSDITEEFIIRQNLQNELAQARKESTAKTDFLSRMSHEIRTPMNGILGMLNLAQTYLDDTAAVSEYLDKTENLSKFLLTLINDILDMSRIESGKMELEQVPFNLRTMAAKIDTMFSGSAKGKGIHWELKTQNFDVNYVIGDEMRLSQVIINFISNALKFTPTNGTISVIFRQMGQIDGKVHLMIRVKDTGKGMKADFIDKIFLPFEQEDASTAHNYGGSGLGMAIADNIIKLMHGEILVESEEDKGSEFIVYVALPVASEAEIAQIVSTSEINSQNLTAQVPLHDLHNEHAEDKTAADDFTLDGLHILLAEDNDINAEIAIEILKLDGAIVDHAHDGLEAYGMYQNSAIGYYDVILMDIQMPNMDGWEATKAIRDLDRDDHDVLIFAMSANAFVEDQRHSLQVGMNAHVNKPIDFEQLRKMIGNELQH